MVILVCIGCLAFMREYEYKIGWMSADEEVARKARIARDELNEQMEEDIENYARAKGIWTIARKCVSLQST